MRRFVALQKAVAILVTAAFSFLCVSVAPVQAAMVGTGEILGAQDSQLARQKVSAFLERQDVIQQLQAWGVTPEEAKARAATMTDEEINQMASKIDQLPAGGDVIGLLLGVAIIGFIALIITDILGVTDVFTFIKKR